MPDYGVAHGVQLYGWDSVTGAWVKLLCNAAGKLIIETSEILEDTTKDGETAKAAQSNWSFDHNANANAHHVAFVAADHTAIGNAAPHHAEAHTLASHTTKAHSELTGVTENQHHARQHSVVSASDHTGRLTKAFMEWTANKLLLGTGAGADPTEIDVPTGAKIKQKSETRALNAATGNVAYTGYGFQPKMIIIFAVMYGTSIGMAIATRQQAIYNATTTAVYATPDYLVFAYGSAGGLQYATLVSFDADGFTLAWTLYGSQAGTIQLEVLAFG